MQTNTHYSFLKKIKAPQQCYFVYCVCDCQNNVIKLGKSNSPFKRVIDHVNNFICYGGSSANNIFCVWSRFYFHSNSNIEKELLNEFKNQSVGSAQIANEFFAPINPMAAENLFCSLVDAISYKKHE